MMWTVILPLYCLDVSLALLSSWSALCLVLVFGTILTFFRAPADGGDAWGPGRKTLGTSLVPKTARWYFSPDFDCFGNTS